MSIHRMILRFDIKAYEILDRTSSILRAMDSVNDISWSELAENPTNREISATLKDMDNKCYCRVVVHPKYIFIEVESANGIQAERLLDAEPCRSSLKLVDSIFTECKISHILRAGLRIFYFEQIQNEHSVQNAFRKITDTNLMDKVESSLGPIADYGLNFDGGTDESNKYHLRIGPSNSNEIEKYAPFLVKYKDELPAFNFVCDMDLYEQNFDVKNSGPKRWAAHTLTRATKTLPEIIETIRNNTR